MECGRGLHERYEKLVNKYAGHPQCPGCAKSLVAELKTAMDKMKAVTRKAKSCTKDDAPVLKQEFLNVQFQLGDVVRAVKECLQTLEFLEEKSKSEYRKDYLHHRNQQAKIAGILKDGGLGDGHSKKLSEVIYNFICLKVNQQQAGSIDDRDVACKLAIVNPPPEEFNFKAPALWARETEFVKGLYEKYMAEWEAIQDAVDETMETKTMWNGAMSRLGVQLLW